MPWTSGRFRTVVMVHAVVMKEMAVPVVTPAALVEMEAANVGGLALATVALVMMVTARSGVPALALVAMVVVSAGALPASAGSSVTTGAATARSASSPTRTQTSVPPPETTQGGGAPPPTDPRATCAARPLA
jgi:hypothetical protein